MDFIIGLAIVITFLSAFIYACWRWPVIMLISITAAAVGMAMGVDTADAATRFEVAAVIESEADRATMQDAVRDAAAIYKDQLDVELVVTDVTVSTIAGHTSATFLLDAVKTYRAQHLTADATVLFTRRTMTQGYQGIATVGPACSAQASAIIAIRNDGEDGAILAHELLHTVGVPHDKASGYLMSETISRSTSRTMSQDSVLTFNAASVVDCMAVAPPAAAKTSTPAAPSTGGGGSTDGVVIAILALLIIARLVIKVRETNADKGDIQLALTKARNAMEDLAMYATQRREESEMHLAVRKQTANLLATCTVDNARLYSALGEADAALTAANVEKVAAKNEVERLKAIILNERRQAEGVRDTLRAATRLAKPSPKVKPRMLSTVGDVYQLMAYHDVVDFRIMSKGTLHDQIHVPAPMVEIIQADVDNLRIVGHRVEVLAM